MTDPLGLVLDLAITAFILIGALFGLVGSWGLVKLPDLMTRLHAPTKATTLGVGGVLIASLLYAMRNGGFSFHELLITLFLFLTAPIASNLLAKVWMHRQAKPEALPKTGRRSGWATYDPPPER